MPDAPSAAPDFVTTGHCPDLQETLDMARDFAPSLLPVLVVAEPGLETTALGELVHAWSGRAGPLVRLHAPAMTYGPEADANQALREAALQAQGGTLLVEEVQELPDGAQALLEDLLVRQARGQPGTDTRVIATCTVLVDQAVEEGALRAGLARRLQLGLLALPPLRERGEDVLLHAERILASHPYLAHRPRRTLTNAAAAVLQAHAWPGNLDELEHALVRAALLTDGAIDGPAVHAALDETELFFSGPERALDDELDEAGDEAEDDDPAARLLVFEGLDLGELLAERLAEAKVPPELLAAFQRVAQRPPAPAILALLVALRDISTQLFLQTIATKGLLTLSEACAVSGLPENLATSLLHELRQAGRVVALGTVDGQPAWGAPSEA